MADGLYRTKVEPSSADAGSARCIKQFRIDCSFWWNSDSNPPFYPPSWAGLNQTEPYATVQCWPLIAPAAVAIRLRLHRHPRLRRRSSPQLAGIKGRSCLAIAFGNRAFHLIAKALEIGATHLPLLDLWIAEWIDRLAVAQNLEVQMRNIEAITGSHLAVARARRVSSPAAAGTPAFLNEASNESWTAPSPAISRVNSWQAASASPPHHCPAGTAQARGPLQEVHHRR